MLFICAVRKIIIETQYAPCTAVFRAMKQADEIVIDGFENYEKGSFRNRTVILGANGLITLSIPLQGGRGQRSISSQVLIDNTSDWQKNHWASITSAYNSSPFFEYYEEKLQAHFQKKYKHLFDFNTELLLKIFELLNREKKICFSKTYEKTPEDYVDYRNKFLPKNQFENEWIYKPYIQVFADRFSFRGNLSVFDILFNCGPEAGSYI